MVKLIIGLFILISILPNSAFSITMFCRDLTASSLEEIEKITGTEDFIFSIDEGETTDALDSRLHALVFDQSHKFSVAERSRLLVAASQLGLARSVRHLLISGVKIDWRAEDEDVSATALFLAAWCEKSEIVDLLLKSGASIEKQSCLPFAGSIATECTYPLYAAISGSNFDGGDPGIICAMRKAEGARFKQIMGLIDTAGLNAQDYLEIINQSNRMDISSSLNGKCQCE
jgi:hypothetical protein